MQWECPIEVHRRVSILKFETLRSTTCGTDQNAVVKVSQDLIDCAHIVFVMSEKEDGHLTFIENNFSPKENWFAIWMYPTATTQEDPELIGLPERRSQNLCFCKAIR